MKKQQKKFIVGAILVLFACWMACSSAWIANIRNREVEIIKSENESIECSGFAFFEFGEVGETSAPARLQVADDIFDTVSGYGYLYCVSPEAIEETRNTVLFCSNQNTYEVVPERRKMRWLEDYYVDVDPTGQRYTAFEFDFCPLSFEKGDYEIYLKGIKEDGTVAAVVNTGYHLLRQAGKTEIVWNPSTEIERLTDYEGWANAGIESIRKDENGDLLINGWGILDGISADETSCILEIFDENGYVGTYTTLPRAITYICDYYESDLYYNCGFMAKIPQFTGSELQINVYVQRDETIYACGYSLQSSGDFSEVEICNRDGLS